MANQFSISWTFPSELTLIEAARALEPHFRAWFGNECELHQAHYTLFTDAHEAFHKQREYTPLLSQIEGQPQNLILHLSGPVRGSDVHQVEIWHQRYTPHDPISITVRISGADLPALTEVRDRSRQKLLATVQDVLGAQLTAGNDSASLSGGGAVAASTQATASIFDQIDQSARVGSPRLPRVFLSYSHDSADHKDWVGRLANRLNSLGIWLIFDQWDLELGGDLPRFMESGISEADCVIVICTETYNGKANSGQGGAGYEKMIMTADLLQDQTSNRIVPVIRGLQSPSKPVFLGSRLHIDFTDDDLFEEKLTELSRALLQIGSQRPPFTPAV